MNQCPLKHPLTICPHDLDAPPYDSLVPPFDDGGGGDDDNDDDDDDDDDEAYGEAYEGIRNPNHIIGHMVGDPET